MKLFANLLLIAGLVVAAVGAANSQVPYRTLSLGAATVLEGQYLYGNELTGTEQEALEALRQRLGDEDFANLEDPRSKLTWIDEAFVLNPDRASHEPLELGSKAEALDALEERLGGEAFSALEDPDADLTWIDEAFVVHPHGSPIGPEVVAALRARGDTSVRVMDPPRASEILPVSLEDTSNLVGRVVAEPIELGRVETTLPAGRKMTAFSLTDIARAGVETLPLEGVENVQLQLADHDPASAEAKQQRKPYEGQVLAEEFTFQKIDEITAGSFIDEPVAQRIVDAGVLEVEAKVLKQFSWQHWQGKWFFVGGVVAMFLGMLLKRSAASVVESEEGESTGYGALVALLDRGRLEVTALADRADGLGAREIHEALDPILAEVCQPFVDGRETLRRRFGARGFAAVMGPFAAGERWLNRAWSAAVDGYEAEARESLREALEPLEDAREALGE